jgi:hypothetical protein
MYCLLSVYISVEFCFTNMFYKSDDDHVDGARLRL